MTKLSQDLQNEDRKDLLSKIFDRMYFLSAGLLTDRFEKRMINTLKFCLSFEHVSLVLCCIFPKIGFIFQKCQKKIVCLKVQIDH